MGSFYSRLSYSFGNEDWRTEHQALKIQPTDRILCITASGDRPLNLLTADCQEIVSLDANPIQNHLLCLKKAALKELDYDEYLAFLGAKKTDKDRLALFDKIQNSLPKDTLHYWQRHREMIQKGVLYEGAIERLLKVLSQMIRYTRGKKINQLFAFDDIENQKAFVNQKWDSKPWRTVFDIGLHPFLTKIFIKDPGLYEHVDERIHVGKHIYQKMHFSLENFLAKENIILSLCLKGRVDEEGFPPYLQKETFSTIKERVDKILFKTIDLLRYLETSKPNSFDCFSLSDVASYMDYESFKRMIKAIVHAAKPNARFCIRQFLTYYDIPKEYAHYFQRDPALEKKLESEDRCFIYNFRVGTINKS